MNERHNFIVVPHDREHKQWVVHSTSDENGLYLINLMIMVAVNCWQLSVSDLHDLAIHQHMSGGIKYIQQVILDTKLVMTLSEHKLACHFVVSIKLNSAVE